VIGLSTYDEVNKSSFEIMEEDYYNELGSFDVYSGDKIDVLGKKPMP